MYIACTKNSYSACTAILQVAFKLFVCLCVGEGEICEHVGELVCVFGGGGGGVEARQVMA